MRTEQAAHPLLKAYQQEIAQRQTRAAETAAPADATRPPAVDGKEAEAPRHPRELSKGRLLDIYG